MIPFYTFDSKGYQTTFSVIPDLFENAIRNDNYGEDRNILDHLLLGEYEHYSFPIKFHQETESGKRFRNIIDAGWPLFLISDKTLGLLTEFNITGWRTYPTEIKDKKGNSVLGYNGFSITGRGGKFDKKFEMGYLDETKEQFGAKVRGAYDLSKWDGSDFFIIKHRWIIVTERVMKLLKKNKIDAIEYEKLSDYVDYIGESRF